MTYTPTNILQYNEYYAHGAPNARSWTRDNTTTNNFLANGGTELNTTTALYDLEYRNYDPILGRMNGVDPMADKYGSLTPYNYSFNSPTMHNDVSGADPTDQTPYWIEESMQRNARRYKGEVIDTYNQFAGLIRTFGVSLSEQRMVGGYSGTGNNSPYLMPLGAELQAQHDLFEMTPQQFVDNQNNREVVYSSSDSERKGSGAFYYTVGTPCGIYLHLNLGDIEAYVLSGFEQGMPRSENFHFYPEKNEKNAYNQMLKDQAHYQQEILGYYVTKQGTNERGILVLPWAGNTYDSSNPWTGMSKSKKTITDWNGNVYIPFQALHTHPADVRPSGKDGDIGVMKELNVYFPGMNGVILGNNAYNLINLNGFPILKGFNNQLLDGTQSLFPLKK